MFIFKRSIILLLLLTTIFVYSQNAKSVIVDKNQISSIKNWNIELQYESLVIEEKENIDSKVKERTIRHNGFSDFELLLLDDIYYTLKYVNKFDIYKDNYTTDGIIKIHPVTFGYGPYLYVVDISFYNKKGELLARIVIESEDQFDKGLNELTPICCKGITSIIK